MAKYSAFKFDTGAKYGATANPPGTGTSGRILLIDWANTGSFDGTNEAVNLQNWTVRRGRQYFVSSSGNGFDHVDVGIATLVMDNKEGRYNPYNTASPLYPNIKPGRYFQFSFRDNANQINYLTMTGKIADIRPVSGGWEQVQFDCVDGLRELSDQDVTIGPEFYAGLSAMINRTLGMAKWAARWGANIQADTTPITLFSPDKSNAKDEINNLADAGLGTIFVARTGKATYYPRNYNGMATYDFDQAQLKKEWVIPQPWEQVRNAVTVICNRQVKQRLAEVWRSERIFVYAHTTKKITAKYDNAMDVGLDKSWTATACMPTDKIPLPGDPTHFYDESHNGEPGEDKKWWMRIKVTPHSKSCDIEIISGSYSDVWVTVVLNGRVFQEKKYECPASDAPSISDYGPRRFTLDSPYLQDLNFAEAYAPMLLSALKDAAAIPVIQIEERPDIQYAPDLFDHAHVTSAKLDIDETFSIGMIEHTGEVKQGTVTRLYLQKVIYNTDVISPMPRDPNLPEIPVEPGPNQPPDTGGVPGIDPCLNDYYAPSNQYPITFTRQTDGSYLTPFPCHLRASQTWSGPSFVTFNGTARHGTLLAVKDGAGVAAATYLSLTGQPNKYVFNVPAALEISGLTFQSIGEAIDPADLVATDSIASGTAAMDGSITTADGFTVGKYYSIECAGGPWHSHATPSGDEYTLDISPNDTDTASIGMQGEGTMHTGTAGNIVRAEAIDSVHARAFWLATTNWIKILPSGINAPGNLPATGSIDYVIRNVTAPTENLGLSFDAVINNVCA